jgi:hypothetical protein
MTEPNVYAQVAQDYLTNAATLLTDHSGRGCPALKGLSWQDPVYPGCEYLAVWFHSFTPTDPVPAPDSSYDRPCTEFSIGLRIVLKLRRCDYPHLTAQGGIVTLPQIAAVNTHTLIEATDQRILDCGLLGLWMTGALFTNPNIDPSQPAIGRRLRVRWEPSMAVRQGPIAGIDKPVTVFIEPCCELPALPGP